MKRKIALLLVICLLASMIPVATSEEGVEIGTVDGIPEVEDGLDLSLPDSGMLDDSIPTMEIEGLDLQLDDEVGLGTDADEPYTGSPEEAEQDEAVNDGESDGGSNKRDGVLAVPKKLTLGVKETFKFNVKNATFKSSKTAVATVSKKGLITAKKKGTTTITVSVKGQKAQKCKVTVLDAPKTITLSGKSRKLSVGDVIMLMPTLPKKTASKIKWTSSKKSVATVDADGVVRALKKGTTKITAKTFNGKKAVCTITVGNWPSSVSFDTETVSIGVKEKVTLKPIINKEAKTTYTWSVKNNKIAKISKKGVVTGVKTGSTEVTVETENGLTATVKVKVAAAPSRVTLNKKKVELAEGATLQLKATLPKKTASQIKWTTSAKKVATVDENGLVTAVAPGEATITAKAFNGKSATCVVTVREQQDEDHFRTFYDGSATGEDIKIDYAKLKMDLISEDEFGDSEDMVKLAEEYNALTLQINDDADQYFAVLEELADILGDIDDVAGQTVMTYGDDGVKVDTDIMSFTILTNAASLRNNDKSFRKTLIDGNNVQIVPNALSDPINIDLEKLTENVVKVSNWLDRIDKLFLKKIEPWLDKLDGICKNAVDSSKKSVDTLETNASAKEETIKASEKSLEKAKKELAQDDLLPEGSKGKLTKKDRAKLIDRINVLEKRIADCNDDLARILKKKPLAVARYMSWQATQALSKTFTVSCRTMIKKYGGVAAAVALDLNKAADVVDVFEHKHPLDGREKEDVVRNKHVEQLDEAMRNAGLSILADVIVNAGLVLADLVLLAPTPAGFTRAFYTKLFGKRLGKQITKRIVKFISEHEKAVTFTGVGVDIVLSETSGHFVNKWMDEMRREENILHGKIRGTINGKVIDADTKKPIAGVLVETDEKGKEKTTKADGTFVLSAMYGDYSGKYAVKCTKEGYVDGAGEVKVDEDQSDAVVTVEMSTCGVPIDEAHFPDANFRYKVRDFDLNANDYLSDEEISKITSVTIENWGVESLEGIKYFTAMTELHCAQNAMKRLDVMECEALRVLDCSDNELIGLNVAGHISLQKLTCFGNPMQSLDVSWCPNLTELNCDGSLGIEGKVKSLNACGCGNLTKLNCSNNDLTLIDVGGCAKLQTLECHNNQLTNLNLKDCASLQKLFCNSNKLTSLDVSGFGKLTDLNCGDNQLTNLDVSALTKLEVLNCSVNELTELDVSGCNALKYLYCSSNKLEILRVGLINALADIQYDNNPSTLKVTVVFGHYDQDNNPSNGKEPIEWIVLKRNGNEVTLISRYALDAKLYHSEDVPITWAACTLRNWLNDTFLNVAFDPSEQDKIRIVKVTAEDNPYYGTEAGSDTYDKVWLLSIREAENLFSSDAARICYPTATAKANGCWTSSSGACWWWLRSPGKYARSAASVYCDGYVVSNGGCYVNGEGGAVRPVVVVRLS